MRFPSKCIVLAACWAAALATPAKIGDGNLGAANAGPGEQDSSGRDPKLLLKFITIAPDACTTTSGQTGICYSVRDCKALTGTAAGICAKGFGVCCHITRTCGATSGFRETTFTSENNPANAGTCQLRITPLNNNVCQLRLDLDEFMLAQPNNEGVCDQDFMTVLAGSPVPTICGDNTGQHMYVDVSSQFGSAVINIDTTSAGAKWSIRVTQIDCDSADRAPSGCLQYFTTTTHIITSFNFEANREAKTHQLANQAYGVCIQSKPGYCSVTYSKEVGSHFSLSGDATPDAYAPALYDTFSQGWRNILVKSEEESIYVPPTVGAVDCTADYLLIPGGTITEGHVFDPELTVESADRFCGIEFPTVTSSIQPFNVFFKADGKEFDPNGESDLGNNGFKISYVMNPC